MPIIKIDNREIDVPAGTKVIEAAERLGIAIPRFCFHPALGSVGACRVCAVSFTDGPVQGIQMSCMIDAQDGMVVSTTDAEAVDFRRHVIELLMLNHPHDCPVCDEGGHCLLQDLTVAGNHGIRRYQGLKRTHHNQDLGPLVQHEMNRCIQCYRCSRYYQEYSGYRDLGVMGIGSRVYFGRTASGTLESPFTGNLTDICPTGVYTDKPSRYFGRRWDYERQPSVCIHCSLGCSLTASARYRRVVRHEARPNADVNGHFICDRGRYGYTYASSDERPRQAMLAGKPDGVDHTLSGVRSRIRQVTEQFGADRIAVVGSSRCSLETLAALKQACQQNGWVGPALTPTARQVLNLRAAINGLQPQLAVSMTGLAAAPDVLVLGADPINEAPMLALALRQVQRRGGRVTVVDPRGIKLPFACDQLTVAPQEMAAVVQALIRQIDSDLAETLPPMTLPAQVDALPIEGLAKRLNSSPRPVVVCGTDITTAAEIQLSAVLARALCRTHIRGGLFYTLAGANAFAAGLMRDEPMAVEQVLDNIRKGGIRMLVAVEADLWREYPDRQRLQVAVARLDHLVILDHVPSPLMEKADAFIPTQNIYESGGHWINNEGRLLAADSLIAGGEPIDVSGGGDHPPRVFDHRIPGSGPLPAFQALAALSEGPDQTAESAAVKLHPALAVPWADSAGRRIDLSASAGPMAAGADLQATGTAAAADGQLTLLLVDWTFGTEPLSAMSPTLNQIESVPMAHMHPDTLADLNVADNYRVTLTTDSGRLALTLQADERVAPGVVVIPRHHLLDWQVVSDTRAIIERSQITAERT
jgi:NADH-quinone oxidoreductase subunit G